MISSGPRWQPTPALSRSVLLPIVLAGVGLAAGRVELVLLGVPLIVGTALALGGTRPPDGVPRVRAIGPKITDVGRPATVAVEIEPSEAQMITTVLVPESPGSLAERVATAAPAEQPRHIVGESTPTTWGTQVLARPDHLVVGADALFIAGPVTAAPRTAQVLPAVTTTLPPGPLPARPAGMVGAHRSQRPGEGTELHDVSPFAPGDRLRRIDWRVTARQAGPHELLYTRHTQVDADADVICCLDSRFDLQPEVRLWSEPATPEDSHDAGPRSIDIGVDTVASIAAAYIAHGDRVGVLDLTRQMDTVRLGSGSRHLLRLRTYLARHTHRPGTADTSALPRRVPRFPPGAVVVVASVFMDDAVAALATSWRRSGHPVLAVDVLPTPVVRMADPAATLAARVVLAERDERLRSLAASGVLVTPADPAALALSLTRLRRVAGRARR